MTQALNFTSKAIAALEAYDPPNVGVAAGMRYIAEKLRQAEVFVLPDHGTLLDRSAPRPDLPGEMYRPPFPVVALEYTSIGAGGRFDGPYTALKASRRIALAFDWQNDLPPPLAAMCKPDLLEGVVIVSLFYSDTEAIWMPVSAGMHFAYSDIARVHGHPTSAFRDAMIAAGRISKRVMSAGSVAGMLVPMLPEALVLGMQQMGEATIIDSLQADLMDEVNAYFDLCCALGCRNVTTERKDAPHKLNWQRLKAGKVPLPAHHILTLGDNPLASGGAAGASGARRSHLRRGHIRRLDATRITWVNQTFVTGAGGFARKTYSVKGGHRG